MDVEPALAMTSGTAVPMGQHQGRWLLSRYLLISMIEMPNALGGTYNDAQQ
ncbi:MAG TPA: hypothetical protein VH023_08555 [Rhodopila sp.]|nr:hypothetical protein [Rhodopila sp.]